MREKKASFLLILFMAIVITIFSAMPARAEVIKPDQVTGVTVEDLVVKWNKVTSSVITIKGYQILVSRHTDFSTYSVYRSAKTDFSATDCLPGRNYFVKVRAYRVVKGKNYFGPWSDIAKIRYEQGEEVKVWNATGRARIASSYAITSLFKQALLDAGAESVTIVNAKVNVDKYDALVVPGGCDVTPSLYGQTFDGAYNTDISRDKRDFAIIKKFEAAGKPILGLCRGIQVINVYYGGTLYQDIGYDHRYEYGTVHSVSGTEATSVFFKCYGNSKLCYCTHHAAVAKRGKNIVATQRREDGYVEAIEHKRKPVIALQWHPEKMDASYQTIFRYFVKKMVKRGLYLPK